MSEFSTIQKLEHALNEKSKYIALQKAKLKVCYDRYEKLKQENAKLIESICEAIAMGENYEYTEYGRRLECIVLLERTLKELESDKLFD